MLEDFFTDEELSAIESMCRDYADYGDEAAAIADSIIAKIYTPAGHAWSMDRHLSTDGDKLCPFYFWFIIMNELADIFGAESEEALLLGQLDAAAVFMEEDFDPTPATEEYA